MTCEVAGDKEKNRMSMNKTGGKGVMKVFVIPRVHRLPPCSSHGCQLHETEEEHDIHKESRTTVAPFRHMLPPDYHGPYNQC